MKYVTTGTVAGVLSFAAVLAGAFGKSALAAFLSDPHTAATVLTVAGGLGALVSGALAGVQAK
ncbi:hypothetical protein DFR50_14236 [Roseiarcus fermentans]|uniref:Uncharacterized protein n=1 Tax=Roseiarcus fermentans TaxID=1473586 RepID=A0A366EN12_9HYPH|nr:hypothetical protein [Roseiarcus fermentans]RBP03788.1 hypothetical protein DFR50_14236 [Roseiarcus fermentans]